MGSSYVRASELIKFTSRQMQAWLALFTHRFILYGGARGGGKSRFLRWALLLLLVFWHGKGHKKVIVGLFCATYPELRDRQISKIASEFPDWLGEIKDTQEYGLGFYLLDKFGGGIIALRNLDDPEKYKSSEFAAIGVDELTLILKPTFDILRGSLRWSGIKHTVFIGATNPDGVGNLWVRELWVERIFPPEMASIQDQFTFIQALPNDNPYLDEQYWQDLNTQPEEIRRAWVEGDWYVFQGQAFGSWRKGTHVIRPFEIPDYWIRKTGTDWGYAKPFCTLWGAKNPDNGRWVLYREVYMAGLTDPRQAKLIKESELPGEKIRKRYADPSMWTKRTDTDIPTSSYDTYAANGIYLDKAINDRLNGKRKVNGILEPLADGTPGLLVFEHVTNLIRTFPSLVYDKAHYEDVDTDGEDHAYDALRYLLTDDVEQEKPKKKPQANPWTTIRSI
jgi:phage terminase large subunit